MRKITIEDVAKKAGVSKGTVSNVFSKKRVVSPEISNLVKKVAKELNYYPSQIAQSLAINKTMTIALKMPQYDDYEVSYFEAQIIRSVVSECSESGYKVLLDRFIEESDEYKKEPVDGVILLNPTYSDKRIAHYESVNMPFVIVGRPEKNVDVHYVDNNNEEMVKQVVEHLIEKGHRDILFLNASRNMTVAQDRKRGYKKAYENYGLIFDEKNILYFDYKDYKTSSDYGYRGILENFDSSKFTAVITDTDRVAFGVLRGARELNIDIPNDMSIIALSNNYRLALETSPQLTSVELYPEKLGKQAVETLFGLMNKELTPKVKVVNADIVFRET